MVCTAGRVGSVARGASASTDGGEGQGHIVAAARVQLVVMVLVMLTILTALSALLAVVYLQQVLWAVTVCLCVFGLSVHMIPQQ